MIYIKNRGFKKKHSQLITSQFFSYILLLSLLLSVCTSIVSVPWRLFILRAVERLPKLTLLVIFTPWKLANTKHLDFIFSP